MPFNLRLQDPDTDAATLLELLAEAAVKSNRGAGVFSFASAHGAHILLNDPAFEAFLRRGRFELIVGVDAVTVPATLDLLSNAEKRFHGLRTSVFLHRRRGALFHPKVCWFSNAEAGWVLAGSGNLTRGGLLNNWEAFGEAILSRKAFARIFKQWIAWLDHNRQRLRRPDDSAAIERARLNETDAHRRHEEDEVEASEDDFETESSASEILIAEIPKAAGRWSQANIDRTSFMEFFQLRPGSSQRVVLFPVASDGTIGEPEIRSSVSVRSSNFRIELGQASGFDYPDKDRPIGVFKKTGTRRFRYRLLMPGQDGHSAVDAVLAERWNGLRRRVRRIRLSSATFKAELPTFNI